MPEKLTSVALDDLLSATTTGVLRALDARRIGADKISTIDLVQNGFFVDIHIIAGGITPALLNRLQPGNFAMPSLGEGLSQ